MSGDVQLFEAMRAGRPDAVREAVHLHYKMIYALALGWTSDPHQAEDVTQETFARAIAAVRSARADSLGGWLAGIARNVVREGWRADKRPRLTPPPAPEPAPSDTRRLNVLKAVAELPDDARDAVLLKYVEGLSCDEVARRLGKPAGTVKSLLSRAYDRLRVPLKGLVS